MTTKTLTLMANSLEKTGKEGYQVLQWVLLVSSDSICNSTTRQATSQPYQWVRSIQSSLLDSMCVQSHTCFASQRSDHDGDNGIPGEFEEINGSLRSSKNLLR